MTPHQQTALDFCRECLGWEEVFGTSPLNGKALCGGSFTEYRVFDPTDLNAVMEAVRGWCEANEASLEMGYYGYTPGEWDVRVATPVSVEEITCADPGHALLTACVEARRKLMGGPTGEPPVP